MQAFLDGYSTQGSAWTGKTYAGVKAAIYRRLAALLGASPDEFALLHNTAEGLNFVSHGLSLSSGDEILLMENEYPSNVYPWEHWREKGVTLKFVPAHAGPGEFLEDFSRALGARTRLASFSAVHWCTGMPLPLEAIGRLCAERGITWVVDGAQGVGLREIDVKACRIDYMAFPAWKWLLGPVGLGALYVSRDRLEALKPVFKGTESVLNDAQYLPYKTELKPGADRFAYSTGSFSDWMYFEASLDLLAALGPERVRARLLELGRRLSQELRAAGFELASDRFGGDETAIAAASRPGLDAAAAVRHLRSRGIVAAERLGRVRLSPHVYNSMAQLDRAVAELAAWKG